MKRGVPILIILVLIVLIVSYFYLIPRIAGERFIRTIARLDMESAQTQLCPDSNLGDTLALVNDGVTRLDTALSSFIGTNLRSVPGRETLAQNLKLASSQYNPLTGIYRATFTLGGEIQVAGMTLSSDITSSPIEYRILRQGILSTCIAPL